MKRNSNKNHRSSLRALMLLVFTAVFSFVPVLASTPSIASANTSTSYVVVVQVNP